MNDYSFIPDNCESSYSRTIKHNMLSYEYRKALEYREQTLQSGFLTVLFASEDSNC